MGKRKKSDSDSETATALEEVGADVDEALESESGDLEGETELETLRRERDEYYDLLTRKQAEFENYRRRFATEARFNYQDMVDQVVLFGSPQHVAERVEVLRQAGVESLILFVNYGGIENQKVKDSLELFATEVMPHFKD